MSEEQNVKSTEKGGSIKGTEASVSGKKSAELPQTEYTYDDYKKDIEEDGKEEEEMFEGVDKDIPKGEEQKYGI